MHDSTIGPGCLEFDVWVSSASTSFDKLHPSAFSNLNSMVALFSYHYNIDSLESFVSFPVSILQLYTNTIVRIMTGLVVNSHHLESLQLPIVIPK